jgi:hypothetical protein
MERKELIDQIIKYRCENLREELNNFTPVNIVQILHANMSALLADDDESGIKVDLVPTTVYCDRCHKHRRVGHDHGLVDELIKVEREKLPAELARLSDDALRERLDEEKQDSLAAWLDEVHPPPNLSYGDETGGWTRYEEPDDLPEGIL